MLRELLYERFKTSTVWWQSMSTVKIRTLYGPLTEIGPVQWVTTHGHTALLRRLQAEMDVLPPPLLCDLTGCRFPAEGIRTTSWAVSAPRPCIGPALGGSQSHGSTS